MSEHGTQQHHESNGNGGHWYLNAVIYQLDVKSFQDGNGDGVGDLRGLLSRLEYIRDLGADCVWLQPLYVSPKRDNGYDVANYCEIDPLLGTMDDFDAVVRRARELGLRIILDLPLNHTSNQHEWYMQARHDRNSKYRPYYIWADEKPENPLQYQIFGDRNADNWQWDDLAGQYYFHTFYEFMPDVNMDHDPAREELLGVARFWMSRGIHGFRMDAVPFIIQATSSVEQLEEPHAFLKRLREVVREVCNDGVLIAEANTKPDEIGRYFGDGDEMHMVLNFYMCNHIFLALATREARHITRAWSELPTIPPNCNWTNFLRNHDELSLDQLTEEEQQQVFEVFAPHEYMRAFGRGIRRRLAPMMNGDVRWQRLAYSLIFTLPGTPVLNLGEEIGLGDDLLQPERESSRTPMHWNAGKNGGFSEAPPEQLYRPVIRSGPFRFEEVNVERQLQDPDSLLNSMRRMIRAYKDTPAFSRGDWKFIETGDAGVLAHRSELDGQSAYALHNFYDHEVTVTLDMPEGARVCFGSQEGGVDGNRVTLEPYGLRWLHSTRADGDERGSE